MKKLILSIGVIALSSSYFANSSYAGGCVICNSGSDECQRVIVNGEDRDGNPTTTVHIFYGNAQPCAEE